MIPVSLSVRLHLYVSSSLALSLPQSSPLYPKRLDSFAPSPFSARASAIRSRTCGRQRLAFLAVSATGGARKPNPSEGAKAATPQAAEFALPSTEGAEKYAQFALQRTGSRGRSRAVHRFASAALPLQNVPRPAAHLNISPKGEIFHTRKARISPRRRRDFTRQRSCRISLRLAETLTPCSSPSARKSRCRA